MLLTSLIYPKKPIPLDAILYKSVHFKTVTTKKPYRPTSSTFVDYELSCDWNKYATPTQSLDLISRQYKKGTSVFKDKKDYFLCGIYVSENLHLDPNQSFQHNPLYSLPEIKGSPNNRAHSIIIGNKEDKDKVKARKKLCDNSKWVVFNEDAVERLRNNP